MNNKEDVPQEVQVALDAYKKEYAKIRDKVKIHREKFAGTIYEECPPLLEEEMKFFEISSYRKRSCSLV